MTLELFFHPFSSYSQKALIALYENATPFKPRLIGPEDPETIQEWMRLWPLRRFPILVEGERVVFEATSVIEYLETVHPGPIRLIPERAEEALDIRMLDRFFDNYVMTPMQRIVLDHRRPEGQRDPHGVAEAKTTLDAAYRWLDDRMGTRIWAGGESFSLADCAAAPALFYADWVHEIGSGQPHAKAYRARLLARPSVARAVDEARSYRGLFPPGAPDRD